MAQEAPRLLAVYHDYRGITAAGLDAAGAAGFGRSLAAALEAALARSAEMAEGGSP
jgi:pyrroline-5-carboxylate reductase